MKKYILRYHINLGWITIFISAGIILIYIMWSLGNINLPPPFIYYSRQLSGSVAGNSKLANQLDLKFHHQEHSLSCEAATLKMVLNYHGVDISESEIINKIPFDLTHRSGDTWGDPNIGFVGNIDGKMMVDGYGVYWGPLALAGSNWKKTQIIKNGSAKDLVENISQGRPVIVWGYLGRGRPVSWKTPDGNMVYGINGEHTRVVYGFKGSPENPDGFMVMDPIFGPAYWEKSKFIRNWDSFGRIGLVVYP